MIESQKFSVVEVARCFRVPLNLIQDHERSTYSNVHEQNRSFLVHTLAPWLTRFEQALAKSLLTEEEKQKFFLNTLPLIFSGLIPRHGLRLTKSHGRPVSCLSMRSGN